MTEYSKVLTGLSLMTETCCLFRHFPVDGVFCILLHQASCEYSNVTWKRFYHVDKGNPIHREVHKRQHVSINRQEPCKILNYLARLVRTMPDLGELCLCLQAVLTALPCMVKVNVTSYAP